jgi:hypothetical protein
MAYNKDENAYYQAKANGDKDGPFCPKCWEKDRKTARFHQFGLDIKCNVCGIHKNSWKIIPMILKLVIKQTPNKRPKTPFLVNKPKNKNPAISCGSNLSHGADEESRTPDLRITNALLCQLSCPLQLWPCQAPVAVPEHAIPEKELLLPIYNRLNLLQYQH